MVDSGSAAEVMYPDLYKALNLISFDGKLVIPKSMIRYPS